MWRATISLPVPDSPEDQHVGVEGRDLLDQAMHGAHRRANVPLGRKRCVPGCVGMTVAHVLRLIQARPTGGVA